MSILCVLASNSPSISHLAVRIIRRIVTILTGAIATSVIVVAFTINKLDKKQMEYNYQNDKQRPEESGQAGHLMSMLVHGYGVDVLGRRYVDFFDMHRMLQLIDILLLRGNVENWRERIRQLDRKHVTCVKLQFHGRVNAAGVTREKPLTRVNKLVERGIKYLL